MSYNSPIEIVVKELQTKMENQTIQIIQSYGISIDKNKLIMALNYDREQYEKGYMDGENARLNIGVKPSLIDKRWHCGSCFTAIGRFWKYCQNCGQKIDRSEMDLDKK